MRYAHHYDRPLALILIACLLLATTGCGDDAPETEQVIPRVKCFTVSERAVGQQRSLSGQVIAGESAPLSFSVGGTVSRVLVERGATVREGQVLAVLDAEPLSLAVEQARGQLVVARESVVESRSQLDNIRSLFNQGAATKVELDSAQANYNTAEANLQSAQADLDRKKFDLNKAQLVAPSAGTIADRTVEPFQEVKPGETAFVIESDTAFRVEVLVPETLIRELDYGQVVLIAFPTLDAEPINGTIGTIGTQAQSGNAFPVEIVLPPKGLDIRSGMSASVTFQFSAYLEDRTAYMIPISCIAVEVDVHHGRQIGPDDEGVKRAPVYILNEESGQIEVREIIIGGLRGNMLEVFEGLSPGDKVVSAGVAFVRDKMQARAWTPEQGLSDG